MTVMAIGLVGMVSVLQAVQMKGVKGEYATYLTMAAGCFIFFYGVAKMENIFEAMQKIQEMVNINKVYLATLLKMTGITYLAEFSSGICKDAGYGAIGSQIEIFGKLSILAVSMPIVLALLETMQGFLA